MRSRLDRGCYLQAALQRAWQEQVSWEALWHSLCRLTPRHHHLTAKDSYDLPQRSWAQRAWSVKFAARRWRNWSEDPKPHSATQLSLTAAQPCARERR